MAEQQLIEGTAYTQIGDLSDALDSLYDEKYGYTQVNPVALMTLILAAKDTLAKQDITEDQ